MNNDLKNFYKKITRSEQNMLSESAKLRVKDKIFSNLGAQTTDEPAKKNDSFLEKLKRFFMMPYVMVPLVLLIFIAGSTAASADAQPGDKLYGVKRQVEELQLLTAPDEEARILLEMNFAERRLEEARLSEELRIEKENQSEHKDPSAKATVEINLDALLSTDTTNPQPATGTNPSTAAESRQQQYEAKVKSKLKSDAKNAVEVLTKIKQTYLDKGQKDKAKQIDVLLHKYIKQKDSSKGTSNKDQGKVEGAKTETKAEPSRSTEPKNSSSTPQPKSKPGPKPILNLNLNPSQPTTPPTPQTATNPPVNTGGSGVASGGSSGTGTAGNSGSTGGSTNGGGSGSGSGGFGGIIGGIGGLLGF
ncbi:hypothetical protein IPM19_00830 [bacterium]|nr:MAG: hypothetical protein IPM19_00830 [bacterium]